MGTRSRTNLAASAKWCRSGLVRLHHIAEILNEIEIDAGAPTQAAIDAVPEDPRQGRPTVQRRFWEQDELIFGGISYTDLPIRQIPYPSNGFNRSGQRVLLGAYTSSERMRTNSHPWRRTMRLAVEYGSRHPHTGRIRKRHLGGLAPFSLHAGMCRRPDRGTRAEHYDNLCHIDWSIVRRRARILHPGLDGRRDPVITRCDHPVAPTRCQDLYVVSNPGNRARSNIDDQTEA